MTTDLAVTSIEQLSKEELLVKYKKLQNKSVAHLGDSEVFVTKDSQGMARACKGFMTLKQELGEIEVISGKAMIGAKGAYKLNQIASLAIVTPQTVIVDGEEKCNPYVERDPVTKVIHSVYVRKIVIGSGPIGNIVSMDYPLFFNIHTYFLQDLQAKIKKYPACGYYGKNKNGEPEAYTATVKEWDKKLKGGKGGYAFNETQEKPTGNMWTFFEIVNTGSDPIGLWVNVSHPEIQACFESHVQRQKFGDRHASSMCIRNALLRHPAIAAQTVIPTGPDKFKTAKVTVYGFRHGLSPNEMNEIAEKAARGEEDANVTVIKEDIQDAEFTEELPDDQEKAEKKETKPAEKKPKEESQKSKEEREETLEVIAEYFESMGQEKVLKIIDEIKGKGKSKGYPKDFSNHDLALIHEKCAIMSGEMGGN